MGSVWSQTAGMGSVWSLYSMAPRELEGFVQSSLRPREDCEKQIEATLDILCTSLQDTPSLGLKKPVARGGAYGRGTALRGSCEGMLVVFVSAWSSFQDQVDPSKREGILDQVEQVLSRCRDIHSLAAGVRVHRAGPQGLSLQLNTGHQSVTFQVLPVFDALGDPGRPHPAAYKALKSTLDRLKDKGAPGEFSACFTELQQKLFAKYPSKLRDLMRLVKHWCQQCLRDTPASPPPLYALELLTAYAWEQACGKEDFDMAEGLRTVLGLIVWWEELCVYWTVNYDFQDETIRNELLKQLHSKSRPVILDPDDPTSNVSGQQVHWRTMEQEAECWLSALRVSGLPGPSWKVLPVSLFMTPGHLLDKSIKVFLQPRKEFLGQVSKAVDIICSILKNNCVWCPSKKIQKTVKGGSFGKGTALKNSSDADIVVFFTSIKSYPSQKTQRSDIIREIRRQLEACPQVKEKQIDLTFQVSKWTEPRVLSFSLKSRDLTESLDFDVLPAFDALGQMTPVSALRPEIYNELVIQHKEHGTLPGEFSTCFTELQRNFVASRPTKVKDLIRLVKHWYKQCEWKLKCKASLPPKYALELLTIYAWEQGSGLDDFDTAEGFRAVLGLVTQYHQLCVFWTVNYGFEAEPVRGFLLIQLQKTRPVILDPADPTGDVGGGDHWCWHVLAREAKEWLDNSPCCIDSSELPVRSWKVPTTQTPGSCGMRIQPAATHLFLRS